MENSCDLKLSAFQVLTLENRYPQDVKTVDRPVPIYFFGRNELCSVVEVKNFFGSEGIERSSKFITSPNISDRVENSFDKEKYVFVSPNPFQ